MDLWIRSQDKNILQKVNKLYVTTYAEENGYGIYDIQEVDDCDIPLGFYKTRERALEILDEIQNILKPKYILDSSSIKPDGDSWVENGMILQNYNAKAEIEELSTYVYEMPKE